MHFMETGACNYPEIGFEFDLEPLTHEKKAETMVLAAAIGGIENSACLCQFADRSLTLPEIVELINAATGLGYDTGSLMETGLRIFHLKRCINYRFGFSSSDDDLPTRLKEPARDGDTAGIEMQFDEMKNQFYKLMEFDTDKGIASRKKLESLGLMDEADIIWPGKI
jgi:aldehyde:ferredoxin oxidoreductase